MQALLEQRRPLFAILDAARDQRILPALARSNENYQSLFEGPKGEQLAPAAPYLVALPVGSPFLWELAGHWGESWGIFLTSRLDFAEVRRHFRHFLLVKSEEGKKLYFRFYDPRVLRVFLPTCRPLELTRFFAVIDSYLIEAEEPRVLLEFTFSNGECRLQRETAG
jgi:hypothetical protein